MLHLEKNGTRNNRIPTELDDELRNILLSSVNLEHFLEKTYQRTLTADLVPTAYPPANLVGAGVLSRDLNPDPYLHSKDTREREKLLIPSCELTMTVKEVTIGILGESSRMQNPYRILIVIPSSTRCFR